MANRATYLARVLVTRLKRLEKTLSEDGMLREQELDERRQEMVAKVLVVEEGITDGLVVHRVASALPRAQATSRTPDRDLAELAEFLARQLNLQ